VHLRNTYPNLVTYPLVGARLDLPQLGHRFAVHYAVPSRPSFLLYGVDTGIQMAMSKGFMKVILALVSTRFAALRKS